MPGLTQSPPKAKPGTAKPKGTTDTQLTPRNKNPGQPNLPPTAAAASGGGTAGPITGDPGSIWNGPVATSQLENEPIQLSGPEGDTLGIHALFPKNSIKAGTVEAYKAAVVKMTQQNQQALADILVNAGILAPHTTGKPYTTKEVQSAFSDTLTQVSQSQSGVNPPGKKPGNGVIPSVTDFLNNAIAQQGTGPNSVTGSAATTTANDQQALNAELTDNFQKIATSYGIPVSQAAIGAHAQAAVAQGLDSTQADANFTEYAKQVATGLYPTLAPQIAGGVDVATLLDPYKQLIQKTTGIDPGTIDFTDPKYSKFLNGNIDPSTNRAAPMTLSQVSQTLMQDPQYGYQNTQEAKNTASSLTASILKTFGAIGNDNVSLSMSGPTPDLSAT